MAARMTMESSHFAVAEPRSLLSDDFGLCFAVDEMASKSLFIPSVILMRKNLSKQTFALHI